MAAVTMSLDDIVDLLASAGKDATMSSRLPLWQILVNFMEGHAWLGFGYEAFWTEDNPLVRVIEGKLHFRPHYSHNGYIELWLGLGFIGLAMMAALLVDFWRRIFSRLTASDRDPVALFALAYGLTFLLQNTAEVTILMRNHMSWGLFVLFYLLACPPAPTRSRAARLAVA
jgi:exopolysaccharide production protein ExoQ